MSNNFSRLKTKSFKIRHFAIFGFIFLGCILPPLVVYVLLYTAISSYVEKHLPTSIEIYDCIFVDSNNNYYLKNKYGSMLVKDQNWGKSNAIDDILLEFGDDLRLLDATGDNQYLYLFVSNYYSRSSASKEYKAYYLVYDTDLSLKYKFDVSSDYYRSLDMLCSSNLLYVYTTNYDNDRLDLHRFDFSNSQDDILMSDVQDNNVYYDDDVTIQLKKDSDNRFTKMRKVSNNTKMFYKFDKFSLLDKEIILDANSIKINDGGMLYTIKTDFATPKFYEAAYVENSKIKFAIYDYLNNAECGRPDSNCICRYGRSHYYVFDLNNKAIKEEKELKEGSFIIDYSQDELIYYYNKKIYNGDIFMRDCEEIEYGEIVKLYFDSVNTRDYYKQFYITCINGVIYGL
ncbi:MAG: hypothetical protein IJ186_03735 [Bacilli bacterium]|nr:hypothetical protein [Bacilli bacterium]